MCGCEPQLGCWPRACALRRRPRGLLAEPPPRPQIMAATIGVKDGPNPPLLPPPPPPHPPSAACVVGDTVRARRPRRPPGRPTRGAGLAPLLVTASVSGSRLVAGALQGSQCGASVPPSVERSSVRRRRQLENTRRTAIVQRIRWLQTRLARRREGRVEV